MVVNSTTMPHKRNRMPNPTDPFDGVSKYTIKELRNIAYKIDQNDSFASIPAMRRAVVEWLRGLSVEEYAAAKKCTDGVYRGQIKAEGDAYSIAADQLERGGHE